MTETPPAVLTGVLLDDSTVVTMTELCQSCVVTSEAVLEMVEYGILEPRGDSPPRWSFRATSLRRVTTARRLQHDLGVNLAGAALALDLLERIERLEARLRIAGQSR
jgi:chaperone modulatory protein CbpM